MDGYFPFLDEIGEAIDTVQDEVIRKATPDTLEHLFGLKRQLIQIRRAASPTREVFNQLTNRDMTLIDADEVVYLRDVYDHVIRLTDELDNFRELAAATLDVYLTQVNNDLSRIMKRLTGVTVLLAGVGAIAGIFGMSEATRRGGQLLARDRGHRRGGRGRRRSRCAGSTGSGRRASPVSPARRGAQPQVTGRASGVDSSGVARSTEIGMAMTWVLPTVPLGPSDVCSQSSSLSAASGSSSVRLVAPDLDDLVQVAQVVAGPDLDDEALLVAALGLQQGQEHARSGHGRRCTWPGPGPAGRAP